MTEPRRKGLALTIEPSFIPQRIPGGMLTAGNWRFLSREFVNTAYQQVLIRSLRNEVKFVPRRGREDDPRVESLAAYYRELFDRYAFDLVLTQWLQDSLDLPFGGVLELHWNEKTGLPDAFWHIDAGTMYVNAGSRAYPYVQLADDQTMKPVAFKEKEIARLVYNLHTDSRQYGYQRSPVEMNYANITACGKLYEYDHKLLSGTPVACSILNLADWTEADAVEWLKGFSEMMLGGISPLKIPVLYENTGAAELIPISKEQDTEKLWKDYISKSGMVYGLGIGDLMYAEHQRTLAGARITLLRSRRTGVGAYAWSVKKAVNRQFFPLGCPIELDWDTHEVEDVVKRRQAEGLRIAYLGQMVQAGAMAAEDMLEQIIKDGDILTIKPEPGVIQPGIRGLPSAPKPERQYPEYPEALQSEAARLAARVVMKSILVEESPAFEKMEDQLKDQLLNKKKALKRKEGIARIIREVRR
jgi:hypothetical protein